MNTPNGRPSNLLLTGGILAMMIAVGIGGFVFFKYMNNIDVQDLMFDTWVNEKRQLFSMLADDISTPVDISGTPQRNDWITRSGGGTLKWSTTLHEVAGEPLSSPAVVDFNNDGRREIVIASAGDTIYCLEPMSGGYWWQDPWTDDVIDYLGQTPQTSGLDFKPPPIFSSVIVADVTMGDTPEVIIGVKDGALCLGSDGQKLWKKGLTSGYYFSTACITDLEGEWNGNKEDLEIILASDDENRNGWLEAFEVDGGAIFREEAPTGGEGGLIGCSVVASNLAGNFYDGHLSINPDPSKERDTDLIIGNHNRGLRIWSRQGENSEGKPNYDESTSGWLGGHQTYATAAIANTTGGPEYEIYIGCSEGYPVEWTGWGGKLYVYTPDGKKLWDYSTGSSRASIFSSPAIADMQVAKDDPEEKHLDYELVFGSDNGKLYCMNTETRSLLWTFDTGGRCMSSPAILNIDNDDNLEIIIASDSGKIFCLDGDPSDGIDEGISYPGDGPTQDVLWVYDVGVPIGISSAVVADIDLDGQLEVVIGDTEGNVYCIAAGGRSVRGQADWPEFHNDLNRTGFYNPQTSYGVDLYMRRDPVSGIAEPAVKSVQPGQFVTYNITCENTGKGISEMNRDKIHVRLDPNSVPEGWRAWLETPQHGGNENPEYVMLASQETANLVLHVFAPWEGEIGEMARINITANSTLDQWASDRLTTLTILDLFVDFDLNFLKQRDQDPLSVLFNKKWDKINPGTEQVYTISILNKGNLNDTYLLSLSDPPLDTGWDWYFMETGTRVDSVTLTSPIFGTAGSVSGTTRTLKVIVPADALRDTMIPITLKGESLKSLSSNVEQVIKYDELIIVVGEYNELQLKIEDSTKFVNPNSTVEFTLFITNMGNKDVIKVRLMAEGIQSGWTVRYPEEDIAVFQGSTYSVPIRITAPGYARAGTKLVMNIQGVIVGTQFRAQAPLTVIVNHVYDFDASVLQKDGIRVNPGSNAWFNVQISNLGNGEDNIKPTSYEIPMDWNLTFYDSEGFQKYEISLDYQANVFLLGRIRIPFDTRTNWYTVGLNISGEGSFKVIYMRVFVNQTFDLRIRTEDGRTDLRTDIQPKQEKPFVAMISNFGNGQEVVTVRLGRQYDPVREQMEVLQDEWEGRFVAVSNTPDFTTNIRPTDFRSPFVISNVGADVYYIPDRDIANRTGTDIRTITTLTLVLDKGQTAWVHFTIKSPENEIVDTTTVTPVQVSATGIGINDWGVLRINLTVLFPDLAFSGKIEISGGSGGRYRNGDVLTIIVKVVNIGDIVAENVDVQLLIDGQEKKVQTLRTVKNQSDDVKTVIFTWIAVTGTHEIKVVLDPENNIIERADQFQQGGSQNNNEIKRVVRVSGSDFIKVAVSNNPIISTLLIILLAIAILVGAALYLKKKNMI